MLGEIAKSGDRELNAVNVILDEKKCTSMKTTLEYIRAKLNSIFVLDTGKDAPGRDPGPGTERDQRDEVSIKPPEACDSSEDSEAEAEPEQREQFRQSDPVSSVREPSLALHRVSQLTGPRGSDVID